MTVTSNQIEQVVLEFIGKDEMFTSVDIANLVKERYGWIKNREVAAWLRANALTLSSSYTSTIIYVNGDLNQATLYYPTWKNADDYKNRNQTALPPMPHQQSQNVTQTSGSVRKLKIRSDASGRLRIPKSIVQELGLCPGDSVDTAKFEVSTPLKNGLIVHADGRVSILRTCLSWSDGPVNVFVNNNKLCFEKI